MMVGSCGASLPTEEEHRDMHGKRVVCGRTCRARVNIVRSQVHLRAERYRVRAVRKRGGDMDEGTAGAQMALAGQKDRP